MYLNLPEEMHVILTDMTLANMYIVMRIYVGLYLEFDSSYYISVHMRVSFSEYIRS